MCAIREIAEINNNKINVYLPLDFPSDMAEIIIFPIENNLVDTIKSKPELPELISIEKNDYASKIILEERK